MPQFHLHNLLVTSPRHEDSWNTAILTSNNNQSII